MVYRPTGYVGDGPGFHSRNSATVITVRLTGGLGNQLFQYAAGTALATMRNTGLLLDLSTLPLDGREYKLGHFKIQAEIVVPELQPPRNIVQKLHGKIAAQVDSRKRWYSRSIVIQPHFHFAPELFCARSDAVLQGYWQSPRYFHAIEPMLRSQFVLTEQFDHPTNWDPLVDSPNAVAIHVRRGDYVSNALYARKYRSLNVGYYQESLQALRWEVGPVQPLVFSDDLDWCRSNLHVLEGVQFVDAGTDIGDFRLMARCAHHIISNSTFAWWSAYLASDQSGKVIAPRNWFSNENDLKDLFPPHWKLIQNDEVHP